jgi:hypothetical protein
MIYFKSVLAGVVAALLAVVLWVLLAFVLPLVLPMVLARLSNDGGVGAGAASAYITSGSILAAALIGFVLGCSWQFRGRTRKA